MREILFRGKRIDNNEWTYGDLIQDGRGYVGMWAQTPSAVNHEVDPETVGQYTDIKDKNGKKVFEHDIVKAYDPLDGIIVKAYDPLDEISFIGVVKYFDGSFYICNTDFCLDYRWVDYELEVIGNVYDNQELLEGDKT